jgi:hypothetical protein
MARSSVSLLPASESAGAAVAAGRAGGSLETATGVAAGASGEVDAGVVARGREATFLAGCDFCAIGWDEVNRERSSRMFRAASQPDRSNKPSPMVVLTRFLIVIPPT